MEGSVSSQWKDLTLKDFEAVVASSPTSQTLPAPLPGWLVVEKPSVRLAPMVIGDDWVFVLREAK